VKDPLRTLAQALAFAIALLAGAQGCASRSHRAAPAFDPRAPLRVAVLPFVDRSEGDSAVAAPLAGAIDLAPFLSSEAFDRAQAASWLRAGVLERLHASALAPIEAVVVDSLLDHRRLSPLGAYAGDRAAKARLFAAALGADAVLLGEVTAWDRSFYLVESIARVGLRLEMRDGVSGALLFECDVSDVERAGISKLPVATDPGGAARAVVGAALQGLGNHALGRLSREVARRALEGILPSAEESRAASAPGIRFVGHDARPGMRPGDELTVVAIGAPGARATARLGDLGPPFPMTEGAPGCYRAAVRLPPRAAMAEAVVEVRLTGDALRASVMRVRAPALEQAMGPGVARLAPSR